MRRSLYERQLLLVAVALLGALSALAVVASGRPRPRALPPALGSYSARAGTIPASPPAAVLGGCNFELGPSTEGIASPVLPCGERLYLSYRGTTVLASVVAREPVAAGAGFDLTPALAARLGLFGVRVVRWSYAGS